MTILDVQKALKSYSGKPIKIMEVCGTHTASIFKHGIRSVISPKIKLISGPGCPVCVTVPAYIDKLIDYGFMDNSCVLTFGDMMKVKGTSMNLTEAKAKGGNIRFVYSPFQALAYATENPHINCIFAAVGFETTVPVYALIIDELIKNGISNLKLLTSVKKIVPAMEYILETEHGIDGFLCPGHVSVITGSKVFNELAERYKKPFVVTGFEAEWSVIIKVESQNTLKFDIISK